MAGERFYLDGGVWKKRGWASVAAGGDPVTPDPLPPPATGQSLWPSSDRYYYDATTNKWKRRDAADVAPGAPARPPGAWMRGAAGDGVPTGAFGTWAGYQPEIAGTWNDASPQVQIEQWSVSSGATFGNWTKPIDTAIGAIWKTQGETWAAAATGAYDARWTQCLNSLKQSRGGGTTGGTGLTGTVKIMPTGDSLTAVDNFALGFKGILLDKLIAGGKSINYVGTKRATGPSTLKDFDHEGIPGATNHTFIGGDYLQQAPLREKVSAHTPDVMTYLVGVNDLWSNHGPTTALTRLRQVMNEVFIAKPNLRVVLCTIPLMGVSQNSQRTEYNNGVRSIATELSAAGKSVTLADMANVLVSSDLQSDGIHWTSGGHTKFANALYPVVLNVINAVTGGQSTTPKGTTYIRFAHEFSGSFMSNWSVSPSEAANFITAWRRFHALKQSIFPDAKLVWCPNSGQSTGLDIRNAWPGNAYVDVYGVDYYNAWPAVNTEAAAAAQFAALETSGAPKGIGAHWQQAQTYGKPFALCEWATFGRTGTAEDGRDAPVWIEYLFNWLSTHETLYEILFNIPSFGAGEYGFYPTTTSPLAAAKYRELWKTAGTVIPPDEPPVEPPPTGSVLVSETWTGSNGAGWAAQWIPGLSGTGSAADIQNNVGRLRTGSLAGSYQGGNTVSRRVTPALPTSFDAVFRFMNEAAECYPHVCFRAESQLDGLRMYSVPLRRNTDVRFEKWTNHSNTPSGTQGTFSKEVSGTWYWCHLRLDGSTFKVKMWGGAKADEPWTGGADGTGFQAQLTDTTYTSGEFGFLHRPGAVGQTNFYVDDLTVTSAGSGGSIYPNQQLYPSLTLYPES